MRHLIRHKKILFLFLLYISLSTVNAFAVNKELIFDFKMHQPLELAPYNTQFLYQDGHLYALSIIKGKILCFKEKGNKWMELQRFGPHDINFTTFDIKDLNGDNVPELIAGTEDPGLIYLYTWDNEQWNILTYGKHVWSTINKIIVGNLSTVGVQEILVQNDEGYLFLLKSSFNSLDLIWKSPIIWKPINEAVVADIDNDQIDEILVAYKTGGSAILKIENNAVISIWENYPWGKVLGLAVGDWDNDQQLEGIFSTSQKILYVLGKNGNQYQYEGQFSDFDCIIEKLSFINKQESKVLITTNTAGQLKALQFDLENRKWVEKLNHNTGRIRRIVQINQEQALFWSSNRQVIELTSYKPIPLQINFQDELYSLEPKALSFNNQIYISPRAIVNYFGFELFYDDETQIYSIITNERTIEIDKNELNYVSINGLSKITLPFASIVFDNELYFPLHTFRSLLGLNFVYDSEKQLISLL
jgi:hypothetical protein